MRLLILCIVLSAILAVSLASPVKTQIRAEADASDSSQSAELTNFERNSSSSEEENQQLQLQKNKDSDEEVNSIDTSEELPEDNNSVKDVANDNRSLEEEEEQVMVNDNDILHLTKVATKSKRSIDFAAHANNKLKGMNGAATKHDKHSKTYRVRHDLEKSRFPRSAETSEENSSEEVEKGEDNGAHEHSEKSAAPPAEGVVIANKPDTSPAESVVKPDTAPAEGEPNPEHSRRRRNADASNEENQSVQEQDLNEVFIFSNEGQPDSEEDFKSDHLKYNEYAILNEKTLGKSEKSLESKSSEEDYAQGCGENNDNQNDDLNENSNEDNETILDNKL